MAQLNAVGPDPDSDEGFRFIELTFAVEAYEKVRFSGLIGQRYSGSSG